MARDYTKELGNSDARDLGVRAWMRARIEHINSQITAADVLSKHGVQLRRHGMQEEQISCPFHGSDKKPSARYFPDSGKSTSHVWCFVCHERWDVVKLWTKFTGTEKFSEILFQIERAFGITPPEPSMIPDLEPVYDPMEDEVESLFLACEKRLKEYRDKFQLEKHLILGAALDQTRFLLDRGNIKLVVARDRLKLVLGKMGEIIRAKTPADPQ